MGMDYRMAGPGQGIGGAARAGPSPDAVEGVALRVAQIAREIDSIRLELGVLGGLDWRSPAAAAFRDCLRERNDALAGAVRDVQAAAAALQLHARHLQSAAAMGSTADYGLGPGGGAGAGAAWRFFG